MSPQDGRLFARLYDGFMRPIERRGLDALRRQWLAPVRGRTIELGAGTGRNLTCYGKQVDELTLVEPNEAMRRRLEASLVGAPATWQVSGASAESLPFDGNCFDWCVSTLVLCSVRDLRQSLSEAYRVLCPGGRLTLIEHIAAPPGTARRQLQQLLSPFWSRLAGGCHLDRDPRTVLSELGFFSERTTLSAFPLVPGYRDLLLCGTWLKDA